MFRHLNIFTRHFSKKMELKLSVQNNNKTSSPPKMANGYTNILSCSDANAIRIAAVQLEAGNVIALPTDTVYGLACSANDPAAIQKLYEIKARDEEKPVAICVPTIKQLKHWGEAKHLSDDLLKHLLPGAVTIVLNKTRYLNNPYLNPGCRKIGIRIPDYDFIQKVSAVFTAPIALTSANKSGQASTLDVKEFKELWPHLGAVFDGGHLGALDHEQEQRAASTVIDLSMPGLYSIIRKGIAVQHTIDVMKQFGIQSC